MSRSDIHQVCCTARHYFQQMFGLNYQTDTAVSSAQTFALVVRDAARAHIDAGMHSRLQRRTFKWLSTPSSAPYPSGTKAQQVSDTSDY